MVKRVYALIGAVSLASTTTTNAFEFSAPSAAVISSPRRTTAAAVAFRTSNTAIFSSSVQPHHVGFSSSIQDSGSLAANVKRGDHPLTAVAIADAARPTMSSAAGGLVSDMLLVDEEFLNQEFQLPSTTKAADSWLSDFALPVVSASLLITGNTIGASCLVLPEVASPIGLLSTTGIFLLAYIFNWVSGITLADVAIQQYENKQAEAEAAAAAEGGSSTSSDSVNMPSSFKEFALDNLKCDKAATAISFLSIFANMCVLSFDLSRAGDIGSTLSGIAPHMVMAGWATCLMGLVSTQSTSRLSQIASLLVMGLFTTFGCILLPGLAAVTDPIGTWLQPGLAMDATASLDAAVTGAAAATATSSSSWLESVSHAAPVLLTTLVYQNVVPIVTKTLNYDRTKTVTALSLGSFLPLMLYVAFCYASLGGGIDASTLAHGGGGLLITAFSLTTLTGSSLGSILSLSEEIDTYIPNVFGSDDNNKDTLAATAAEDTGGNFELPSVMTAVAVPLVAAVALSGGDDITTALQLAGSFGSPLLYGVLPALMAYNQRQERIQEQESEVPKPAFVPPQLPQIPRSQRRQQQQPILPTATLGALGFLSTGFVGEELISKVGEMMPALV